VREVTVEAHADAQAGDHVEHDGDHDVVPAQAPSPGQRDGGEQRKHRDDDEERDEGLLAAADRLGF
jgi:hypothetical protein